MRLPIWSIVNSVLIIVLAAYCYFKLPGKTGFVINQKVFDSYKGKIDLEEKLVALTKRNKNFIDSLNLVLETTGGEAAIKAYQMAVYQTQLEEEELSKKYTADIWKRINEEILTFGKEENYDFIYGASGDGSLMYAEDSNNITEEIIRYLNAKYDSGN